jgi:hypothetical protein
VLHFAGDSTYFIGRPWLCHNGEYILSPLGDGGMDFGSPFSEPGVGKVGIKAIDLIFGLVKTL